MTSNDVNIQLKPPLLTSNSMISSLCQRRIFRYNNNNNNKTPFIKTNKKKKCGFCMKYIATDLLV